MNYSGNCALALDSGANFVGISSKIYAVPGETGLRFWNRIQNLQAESATVNRFHHLEDDGNTPKSANALHRLKPGRKEVALRVFKRKTAIPDSGTAFNYVTRRKPHDQFLVTDVVHILRQLSIQKSLQLLLVTVTFPGDSDETAFFVCGDQSPLTPYGEYLSWFFDTKLVVGVIERDARFHLHYLIAVSPAYFKLLNLSDWIFCVQLSWYNHLPTFALLRSNGRRCSHPSVDVREFNVSTTHEHSYLSKPTQVCGKKLSHAFGSRIIRPKKWLWITSQLKQLSKSDFFIKSARFSSFGQIEHFVESFKRKSKTSWSSIKGYNAKEIGVTTFGVTQRQSASSHKDLNTQVDELFRILDSQPDYGSNFQPFSLTVRYWRAACIVKISWSFRAPRKTKSSSKKQPP